MIRRLLIAAPLIGVLFWTGCRGAIIAPVVPPRGALFTNYSAPLSIDYSNTPTQSKKTGTSSTWYFREPFITNLDFAFGSAGIEEAARDGNLSQIDYADYHYLNVLSVVGRFTVEAHGE